jgi:hypothetical protein
LRTSSDAVKTSSLGIRTIITLLNALDEELYKKITRMSYPEHVPLEKLINDMLKEYLNVYALSEKIGYAFAATIIPVALSLLSVILINIS